MGEAKGFGPGSPNSLGVVWGFDFACEPRLKSWRAARPTVPKGSTVPDLANAVRTQTRCAQGLSVRVESKIWDAVFADHVFPHVKPRASHLPKAPTLFKVRQHRGRIVVDEQRLRQLH